MDVAVDVLQSDNQAIPEVRNWALGVLKQTLKEAGQALPEAAQKELEKNPLPKSISSLVVPKSDTALEMFFEGYRANFGPLTEEKIDNLRELFSHISEDRDVQDVRYVAYILATIMHETGGTFATTTEICPNPLSRTCEEDDGNYRGRGYIQLSLRANYQRFGALIGVDLAGSPELALQPKFAYEITSILMIEGSGTGKKLSDYINDSGTDYVGARKVVSGGPNSRAKSIGADAEKLESILRRSLGIKQ